MAPQDAFHCALSMIIGNSAEPKVGAHLEKQPNCLKIATEHMFLSCSIKMIAT
jgi:hypothetical protein